MTEIQPDAALYSWGSYNAAKRAATNEDPSVLVEARMLIHGKRRGEYGPVEESFDKIWAGWQVILASQVPGAERVALCMDWLKTVRYLTGRQRDSLVDKAGYVGLCDMLRVAEDADSPTP